MILDAIFNVIYVILDKILVFDLPSLPDSVTAIIDEIVGYVVTGLSVLRAFVGDTAMSVFGVCLVLIVAMNGLYLTYSVVFWIIRKLPVLNVRE